MDSKELRGAIEDWVDTNDEGFVPDSEIDKFMSILSENCWLKDEGSNSLGRPVKLIEVNSED